MPALPFGVVPIFANATAALLPAILAGLSSALALVLRPRELVRRVADSCRRRPGRAVVICLAIAALVAAICTWGRAADSRASSRERGGGDVPTSVDWPEVARQLLRLQAGGAAGGGSGSAPERTSVELIYRGDAARCGHDGGASPRDLRLLWRYQQPESMFLSSPLVDGDRAFAASCMLDVEDSYGAVVCLSVADGSELWITEAVLIDGDEVELRGIFSSPALSADGSRVVIGQGLHPDSHCDLICLDADTGKLIWRVPTSLHIESSPAISGDLVIVGAGAIETGVDHLPAGDPGFVLAVSLSTGNELWRHPVRDPESSPVIVGDRIVIGSGFGGNALIALSTLAPDELARAGRSRELWRVETRYPMTGAVSCRGDLVVAGGGAGDFVFAAAEPGGEVVACDLETGEVRWRRDDLTDAVLGAVALAEDLAICGVRDGRVLALELDGGQTRWETIVSTSSPVLAGAAVGDGIVHVLVSDGAMVALDVTDGRELERSYVNDDSRPGERRLTLGAPTVRDSLLFVGSETGGLRCYRGDR